ncbi:hypothetical protein DT076_08035 [Desertihabitans brevis]|uniref:Phospholipase n=1 Tax=Desertihabitans brevis TaxID=2268447 RepID=A0A367YY60_9ACTN|nr:phospholipase A2 family protein [Desertihabitans brevis]RCK69952.1 hypothetical protein DT076_08035 [Desertihabitans brevis]
MSPTPRRQLLTLLACLTALTLLPLSTGPAAAGEPDDFTALAEEVTRFTTTDADGRPVFDAEAAAAAGASPEVLEAGRLVPAAGRIGAATTAGELRTADGIPVWGNWCGPGHGSGEPVDTLDTLCMHHDLCYRERGYFDCACDARLKAEIARHADRMATGERLMAAAITAAFSVIPCVP